MQKAVVQSQEAPKAIGPYSQAIKTDSMVFVSGQLGIDPDSGDLILDDIKKETRQALTNVKKILDAAGSSLEQVVKTTVFISDMSQFANVNEVYGEFFSQAPPARACVQVAALPKGGNVEIEAVALL